MKNMLITLFAILVLALNISCLKKQNLEDQNLGPAVTAKDVQDKMSESIGELDFGTVKVGEANSLMSSITLEDTQNIKRFKQDIRVKSITNTQTEFSIDFIHSSENFLQPDLSFSNIERKYMPTSPTKNDPLLLPILYYFTGRDTCKEDQVSCHNLTVAPVKVNLNPALVDTKICPDPQVCQISARKIEFDLLDGKELNDQGKPSRSHYTFMVAGQLPFFSKVLQYCVRGLMPYNSRKVLAENCVFVNSINSGQ
jgi:hypothetical protein